MLEELVEGGVVAARDQKTEGKGQKGNEFHRVGPLEKGKGKG